MSFVTCVTNHLDTGVSQLVPLRHLDDTHFVAQTSIGPLRSTQPMVHGDSQEQQPPVLMSHICGL